MTHRIIIAALLVGFLSSVADAQNRRHRRRGAILGGVAGAAIGVAIGDKGGNETAGALIGGAVGAIAGGAIGNRKDQRIEHGQRHHSGYYQPAYPVHQQPAYHPHAPIYVEPIHAEPIYAQPFHTVPVYPVPIQTAPIRTAPIPHRVTVNDVILMQRRGLSESTILRLIHDNGLATRPSVSQVIDLHEHGVSERVIAAMQGDPVH